jgi:hypothetical protein
MNDQVASENNEATAAKVKFCSKEYDFDSGVAEFNFGNGTTLTVNVDELSDDIKRELMFHGAMQKVGDSYAGAKGVFADGIQWAKDVIEQLKTGQWKASRGGGEAKPRTTELAAAIARIKGIDLAAVQEKVASASDEQRKAWRALPQVKAQIAIIREEKARAALAKAMEKGDEGLDFPV